MKKLIFAAVAFVAFAVNANAQASKTATQQVNLSLTDLLEFTFTGSGTSTGDVVTMPFSTLNDYTNGVISNAQTLNVNSNRDFVVTVNASAANFTYSGSVSNAPTMNVANVLGIKVSANGAGSSITAPYSAFTPLNTTATQILAGTRGSGKTFAVQYQATPGFAFPGGTYTVSVVYTTTQQ